MTEFIKSFEEVDTAMFDRFTGCVIDGKIIEPTYYTPDIDLEELAPPSIVIYRTMPFRDLSRWSNEREFRDNLKYDEKGNLVQMDKREMPEPWSIMYTVKTIYEYQMDGVMLNDQILRLFRRDDFITIKGVNYTVDQLSAGVWGSQYKDFGRVEEGKRRLQETYSYRVDIWLEIADRNTVKTVQEIGVKATPNV